MGNIRFKVGDRVLIKSIDWYNENKDKDGIVGVSPHVFIPEMLEHCGTIVTIKNVFEDTNGKAVYYMKEIDWNWTDEMIEGLVEEENKPNIIEEAKTYWDSIKDAWICPEGYIFKDENGNEILTSKIILEKKKKEYPKTYEECCEIMNVIMETEIVADVYSERLDAYELNLDTKIENLRKLLICRDAYWKIAGDEMGLGKPWELTIGVPIYYLFYNRTCGSITKSYADDVHGNIVFAFPTEEMRDAFYENFKEEIEQCKELL